VFRAGREPDQEVNIQGFKEVRWGFQTADDATAFAESLLGLTAQNSILLLSVVDSYDESFGRKVYKDTYSSLLRQTAAMPLLTRRGNSQAPLNALDQAVQSDTEPNIFWQEVKQRRDLFHLGWIGCPIVWAAFVKTNETLSKYQSDSFVSCGLAIGWAAVCYWATRRLTEFPCPKCHGPAIDHPLFLMRNAKCRRCGFSNVNTRNW
jgi:hypothetical protein